MVNTRVLSFHFNQKRRFVLALMCCVVALGAMCENVVAQGAPNLNGGGGLAASGSETAQRLKDEKANKYRVGQGGVGSEQDVLKNMQELFKDILLGSGTGGGGSSSKLDKWFSPHLRDMNISNSDRQQEAAGGLTSRAWAGYIDWVWFCTGACSGCIWGDDHYEGACCSGPTLAYGAMTTDTNFKACCVRQGEERMTMEAIACMHPTGDGWAGLFEYYYPTTAIGWEAQRATTMIATDQQVKQCLQQSDSLMENANWVTQAIQKGMGVSDGSISQKVSDVIKDIRPKDEKLKFSDSLQGGGLTMRVNFAHMDPEQRVALAEEYCMHPQQFMKLMDPAQDRLQMQGGPSLAALQQIPMWANYCPNAVKLMTDPNETSKVVNFDNTPTNFWLGMMAYEQDPLYCQKMNVTANPVGGEFLLKGALKNAPFSALTDQMTGYTCRTGTQNSGGYSTRMVPVTLHSTAKIDPRTLDHAIPFMIAGGYYLGEMASIISFQSLYKRFEPLPYSKSFDVFTGKKFAGGGVNELGMPCRQYEGKDYQGKNQPDQLYLSNKNHKPFDQEPVQTFNKYDRDWAGTEKDKFHNRNLDKSALNYGAAFRIFATCPAGYVRWRGEHSEKFDKACGEEHFGGRNLFGGF